MQISNKGLDLIKNEEQFRSKPYLCPAKIPTIGYGCTFYANGKKVSLNDKSISKEEAAQLLIAVIDREFDINPLIKVNITQNQFDALTSFAYNVGIGNFINSTLLKKLNEKDFKGASLEFPKWIRAGGKVLKGLVNRRAKERALFLS